MQLNKILLFFVILLFVSFVSADNSFGMIKQNDCINLEQSCANCTYINITSILYPNSSVAVSNIAMDLTGTKATYSFCNTSKVGIYSVKGTGNPDGIVDIFEGTFEVTVTGNTFTTIQISIYLFFFFLCILIIYFSVRLIQNNSMTKDISHKELYETRKRNEFLYYVELLKRKFWIIGFFGVYLSTLLFISLLDQLLYNLNLSEIANVLWYPVLIMTWGLIPFTIFWFVYLIIIFYKSTTETMRWQFGAIAGVKK